MYICIEGNIGAGKTTLAQTLSKRRNAIFLAENFDNNPLLPLFYKNKKRMAFALEYSFLLSRFTQLDAHFKSRPKKMTVADFSLYKCLWFARANLKKQDYTLYKKQFRIIEEELKAPGLIIYINTNYRNLLKNIKQRGRTYEKNIDKNYLAEVNKSYVSGLKKLKNIPVIEFYVNGYSPKMSETIVNRVDDILKKGIKFKYKKIAI